MIAVALRSMSRFLLVLLAAAVAPRVLAADTVVGARFSAAHPGGAMPEAWQPFTFARIHRHTRYSLVADDSGTAVKAEADASASGLIRLLDVDPAALPLLEWRWKVESLPAKSDPTRKKGDDYAARIYVAFRFDPARASMAQRAKHAMAKAIYGEDVPNAAINYIWATATPVGTVLANAYTDRVRMIVVRSGAADLGRWVRERRNVYEDYRRAFGEAPPPISGIAIMTDTDDTAGRAVAFYGDIVLEAR